MPLIKFKINVSQPGDNSTIIVARARGFAAIVEGKVLIYNKALNVWSLGKLV